MAADEFTCGKVTHPTKKQALLACRQYHDQEQRPYYCPKCCGWHTSKQGRSFRRPTMFDGLLDELMEKSKRG